MENPSTIETEYDPEKLQAELERAAAEIDYEIERIEEAKRVTWKDLQKEFGCAA